MLRKNFLLVLGQYFLIKNIFISRNTMIHLIQGIDVFKTTRWTERTNGNIFFMFYTYFFQLNN